MNKILIVYYSKSGHTEQIAKELAELCGADIEAIQSSDDGDKGFRFLGALFSTGGQKGSAIEPAVTNPDDYDVVVIGSPVWMYKLSSFAREYLKLHADQMKKVAFFCTEGGAGDDKVFQQMSEEAHQQPIATLVVNEKELKEENYQAKLAEFASKLAVEQTAA